MARSHGMSGHPDYQLWKGMRARCGNPKHKGYPNYGGRGVKVCARWDDFATFLSDMGPRPDGHTLDRIDTNGDYEPTNCRWVTDSTQRRNRRDNVLLTLHGRTMVMEDWAKELGVSQRMLCARLERGWSATEALTRPVRRTSRTVTTGSL
jgi:hypothetical protein